MAPVAGPSSRKRTAKQCDSENDAVRSSKAPLESFGQLELAQENGDEEGSIDEDYGSDEDGDDDSEDDDGAFPELDDAEDSDSGSSSESELSEEEQILRELAEEEALEADLLGDSSDTSSAGSEYGEDALDHAIRRATRKPVEDFQNIDNDNPASGKSNSELLGFDTRSYKDKARVGKSAITGEERWTWDEIHPGWDSDEGAEEGENRVGKIPDYFYEGMPHVGYNIDGKKVMRPAKGDELDKFLASIDDPSSW